MTPEHDTALPPIPPSAPFPVASPPPSNASVTQDAKTMAMLAHILPIVVGFWGPLIIWFLKKDENPYINEQAKEALNFQITAIIASFVCILLCFVLVGFVLLPIVGIGNLVFCILAAMAASRGEHYRYPYVIRIIQ